MNFAMLCVVFWRLLITPLFFLGVNTVLALIFIQKLETRQRHQGGSLMTNSGSHFLCSFAVRHRHPILTMPEVLSVNHHSLTHVHSVI